MIQAGQRVLDSFPMSTQQRVTKHVSAAGQTHVGSYSSLQVTGGLVSETEQPKLAHHFKYGTGLVSPKRNFLW